MVTYIYFVKCPNCEDEPFDFFDEAKGYAMGCLSQKPVITQTEVCRNDFGECTDSADLGQVWSWEDECEPEAEPITFSKDDINTAYDPDTDPEFQDDDFFAINAEDSKEPVTEEFDRVRAAAQCSRNCYDFYKAISSKAPAKDIKKFAKAAAKFVKDQYGLTGEAAEDLLWSGYVVWKKLHENSKTDSLTEAKTDPFHEAIFEAIDYLTEFNDIFPVPDNIGADSWGELKDDIRYGLSSDFEIAEIIMEYLDKDLAISRKHPEMFEDDPQSELTLETYNRLKRAYDRAVAAYEADHPEDFEESCRKPIPEGMTIEQLVEEMEENEDTVECVLCQDLFDKSTCRKELNLGWLCHRCADDLTARGEGPVFKEDNYWDFLDEDVESLDEAQAAPIPNFTYLAGEASARDMIIGELLSQKVFGVRRRLDGSIEVDVYVSFDSWGTTVKDINVTPNGRIILDCLDNRVNAVKQRDLQVLVNSKPKKGDGSKFLTALKAVATKLNKGLDTRTRRERRDDAVAVRITPEIAEYLRDHITNIHFKVPMRTYDFADIKNIEANYDASDETCEAAANRINSINDRFFSQPFADDAEAAGMVSDRIPNEPAAWITSSWGAEAKITFDRPIKDLVINKGAEDEVKISDIIQAYQWKASTKVNVEKNVVDCFSLVVELIRRFNNDVRFFEKNSVTEDVADAFDLDFPEV